MVIRKNISLEQSYLKKLELLTNKHNGNLSAAIRDAIDIADAALKKYGSYEEALSKINSGKKDLTGREESITSGRNVLINRPVFLWLLKWTKGIPLESEVFEEMLDPLKIRTISELDKKINELSSESGWNCQVSIFCMDDINPTTATLTVTGENEFYRDFVSQLVAMFLVNNKVLDIDVVHKRATTTRIDFKGREKEMPPLNALSYFGYLKGVMSEFRSREEFWKNLVEIYRSLKYNMITVYRGSYEELLTGNMDADAIIFESISKKHIASIPHQEFLKMLKKIEESVLRVDKIEILENSINIYHSYKKEKAIQKMQDYFVSLLRENGHEYNAKYSSSLIVLNHVCCGNS